MRRTKKGGGDALVTMRQIFLTFALSLVWFQIVLIFLPTGPDKSNEFAVGLLLLGALSCFLFRPLVDKQPLNCTSSKTLAGSFSTRFFVRIAFAQAAALFGFVGFFTANVRWVYPLGVLIAAVGYITAAPSKRNLSRDQAELRRRGCSLSLVRALRGLDVT